jgi:Leucine-rich repeat (LRR) protein
MIPMEIGNLARTLKVLNISSNKLKSITTGIRELHNLEVLHLQDNQLKALPDKLSLPNLRECLLTNNELELFNLPVHTMHALQKLGLDWFAYLCPPASKIIDRNERLSTETPKLKINESGLVSPRRQWLGSKEANDVLSRSKSIQALPSTRIKTFSTYSKMPQSQPEDKLDHFKSLVTLFEQSTKHDLPRTNGVTLIQFARHFMKPETNWINKVDERGRSMLHYVAL